MRIDQPEVERAMSKLAFTREQYAALWQELNIRPSVEARFEPAHVGYFFGTLLVIGAMGWSITDGWDRFAGWQLTAIATAYATVFAVSGSQLWRKSLFRIPGGLLITMAVCMTPLAVYGIERQLKLWPQLDPGSPHYLLEIHYPSRGLSQAAATAPVKWVRVYLTSPLSRRIPCGRERCLYTRS